MILNAATLKGLGSMLTRLDLKRHKIIQKTREAAADIEEAHQKTINKLKTCVRKV